MDISIPKDLDLESSLKFCEELEKFDGESLYRYDYNKMSRVEPFGMLLVGSKIRKFNDASEHFEVNFEDKKYAANMGFFHSVRQNYGKNPSELIGNCNYMPIKKVNIKNSYREAYDKGIEIYNYIENNVAGKLANVIARDDENLKTTLKYCITEVLRNIYEHSQSKEFWYAGQFWPSEDLVEVAILDEGIGIFETLKRNRKLCIKDESEALNLALFPGISKSLVSKRAYDIYSNSGFGLYMLKNICDEVGEFAICSKNICIVSNKKGIDKFNTSFDGTAIRIRIRTSKIPKTGDLINKIKEKGQDIFNTYSTLDKISLESIRTV